MPTYSTPQEAIIDRLATSVALAIVLGADDPLRVFVFNRPLKSDGKGVSSEMRSAFDADKHVKPSLVVPDKQENRDPSGPLTAYMAFPEVWFYAPATSDGKTVIKNAFWEVFGLLNGWHYTTSQGTGVELAIVDRLGVDDDEFLAGAVRDRMTLQADGLWRLGG